jgi:spermidine/putrescine transport system permease protein
MLGKIFLRWGVWLWFFAAIVFVYAPVFVMVCFSFNSGQSFGGWEGFSLKWYQHFFGAEDMIAALGGSLAVGCLSTFFSVALSLILVVASRWWQPWWLLEIFMVNFAVPEIFLAVIVLNIFVFLKVKMGLVSLVVGHALLGFGAAVPFFRDAFAELPQALIDSSLDLGATYFQTFRYIILPVLKPGIIYVSFIVFTLSMDDFFINFFCSGVGFPTVSTYVYTTIKAYVDPSLNALSSTLFFLSFTLVLLLTFSQSIDEVFSDD